MQHQIVITLNPEEYREIQRLAKMAGTTSIGQFLHTRLLTFLGMRSSKRRLDTNYDTEKTVDLTQLGDTITRMHKELKQLLEHGEISGYVTGTAPPENLRDSLISFKFETILQNDYNATPSQPVFIPAETIFSELGVTLPNADSGLEVVPEQVSTFNFDSLPPVDSVEEQVTLPESNPNPASTPSLLNELEPELENQQVQAQSEPVKEEKEEQKEESEIERKIDFRIKPQTAEEAIQAAKSIEDELERLAEQAFAQSPLSGSAPVQQTPIAPLAANDPLVDILDEGLVKILEEKMASKITSDFVKPKLDEIDQKNALEINESPEEKQEKEPNALGVSNQETDSDEEACKTSDGFGPPPKRRKK